MTEVIAGRMDFFFGPVGLVLPNVKEGNLVPLKVNGAERAAALPDVPTTREAGYIDAEFPSWFGIFLPAKTPRDVVDKLHHETLKALQAPKVRDKLTALGLDPMVMTPGRVRCACAKGNRHQRRLVKAAGIKAN